MNMLDINISDEEETDNRIDFKGQWFADDVIITISDQNEKLGSISVPWAEFARLYKALKKSKKRYKKMKKISINDDLLQLNQSIMMSAGLIQLKCL